MSETGKHAVCLGCSGGEGLVCDKSAKVGRSKTMQGPLGHIKKWSIFLLQDQWEATNRY